MRAARASLVWTRSVRAIVRNVVLRFGSVFWLSPNPLPSRVVVLQEFVGLRPEAVA